MIRFTKLSDNKSVVFNQFDHKYKFLYKDRVLWSILDAFDSEPKHVYRLRVLEGDNIQMEVDNSLKEKLIDGYIYGYDDIKDQILKIKSRKIEDSTFVNMNEQFESVQLIFSKDDEILFIDHFYDCVVRKNELVKSVYIFADQLYKIVQYKDVIEVIQLTHFKSLVTCMNVKKSQNGKTLKSFTIEQNSKLIGDTIVPISSDDYHFIENCNLDLMVEIC